MYIIVDTATMMTEIGFGTLLILVVLNFGFLTAVPKNPRQYNSTLNTDNTILGAGYPVEVHQVITPDGYILKMHRIPHGRDEAPSAEAKPAVFLMHGLTSASNAWVANGDLSPAYNFADAGFDVWMGNARGNKDSRFHVSLDPDDDEEKFYFFDFTWEEIGSIDLPSMLDYVLEETGNEKLHYIGHSQGGTAFLVLNSLRPEYNEKFLSAHLMAGVGYQEYFPDAELAGFAAFTNMIYVLALDMGLVEIFPPGFNISDLPDFFPFPRNTYGCHLGLGLRGICDVAGVQQLMLRNDGTAAEQEMDLDSFGGAATKQIAHYGQNIDAKLFRRWDHGTATNLQVYGTETPPLYDISLITVYTTMHYTVGDHLLDERDVLAMAAVMPNTVVRRVARDTFSHSDFVIASDARELVTDYIIDAIRAAENGFVAPEEEGSGQGGEDVEAVTIDDNNNTNSSSMLSVGVLLNACLFVILMLNTSTKH